MAQSVSHLTQSRYFSPIFNAAVFDGPIRIYFAQHQEATALNIYFRLQNHMKESYALARQIFKQNGQTIFLMLYPNIESYGDCFSRTEEGVVARDFLGEDFVIGVKSTIEDEQFNLICAEVEEILRSVTVSPERTAEM